MPLARAPAARATSSTSACTRLFIAEKPSVAKAIAAELGVIKREDGYLLCKGNIAVTWCFGHLLEQAEPDAYLPDDIPKTKKGTKIWRMEDLPIFPKEWIAIPKPDKGVKKQLAVIRALLKGAGEVVHAGDPDREGQLLVDEVLEHFKCRKPIQRFWVSAVDPASIQKGLGHLTPNADYAGMRDAARGRSRADWLLGMNLSRAYTLTNIGENGKRSLIAVGRVQTPTLMMVARRDYAVRNFVPKPYFTISASLASQGIEFTAKWKPIPDQKGLDPEGKLLVDLDRGRAIVERLNTVKTARVVSAETKRKKAFPPKGYSLADIQIEASKRFGMTAEETLKVCQSLYETHKITSYPRTDCSYLPESQHADASAVLQAVARTLPAAATAVAKADVSIKSPAFNDKKVTAHHAIVPVANSVSWDALNANEQRLYRLIAKRYLAQFFPAHEYEETEIVLDIGGKTFVAKGRVVVVKGWKILLDSEETKEDGKDTEKDGAAQTLPALVKDDEVDVLSVAGKEDKTKPPAFFTEGTLIAAMENIWRSFEDPEIQERLKEAGGIGTPATRAAIISELRRKAYLEADGKKLHCSEMGRALLKTVSKAITSPVMTAHFEQRLQAIESKGISLDDFVREFEDFVEAELTALLRQRKDRQSPLN